MNYPDNDNQFEEKTITVIEGNAEDGWALQRDDGWSFFVRAGSPEPHVGSKARFYGKGVGYSVRGLFIDGQKCFYETETDFCARRARELEADNEKKRQEYIAAEPGFDKRIAALPACFQDRINGFRKRNPDFGWQFESYELFCCEQAVIIANSQHGTNALSDFSKRPWEEQKYLCPSLDDGHSGNTLGCACMLAQVFLENEALVKDVHGAMCPVVGCKEYGCYATSPEAKAVEENSHVRP